MKRAFMAAVLAAAAAAACSDDDPAAPGTTGPDGGTPGSSGGTLPVLSLDGGGGSTTPESQIPMFDFDAGPANPVPVDTGKRRIWAVDERRHLLRILAEDPNNVVDVTLIDLPEPARNDHILGIDFRPANGQLYAISTGSRLFTIDLTLAKGTAIGVAPTNPVVSGQAFGFDVNPVADKLRVHSDVDQNLRLDPVTGAVVGTDKALAFGATDVNYLQSPNLVGTAYTNSVAPTPATTVLYAIDSTRNLLTKVDPPNEGVVTTIGALGVDVEAMAGFDIWGSDPTPEAYAALRVQGESKFGLYRINLTTGAATLVGPINHPSPLRGIAVQP